MYDALGSRLFDAITDLPEYYPTRTEAAIFARHGADMARHVPEGAVMIDLGAGSCDKATRLFPVLQPSAYVPVDISVDYLRDTLAALQERHPDLPMLGMGMDFSQRFTLGENGQSVARRPRAGTAIRAACSTRVRASATSCPMKRWRCCARPTRCVLRAARAVDLLIGVDRVKPREVLEPAYDDSLGVTAAFNRNLLLHVNRLLEADFSPAEPGDHVGLFNAELSRIEMHLEARDNRRPCAGRAERSTLLWASACTPRIPTSGSPHELPGAAAGSRIRKRTRHWTDERGWFSVFWAPA